MEQVRDGRFPTESDFTEADVPDMRLFMAHTIDDQAQNGAPLSMHSSKASPDMQSIIESIVSACRAYRDAHHARREMLISQNVIAQNTSPIFLWDVTDNSWTKKT